MKAFRITLWDEVGIIAAPTASKARYLIYRHLRELNARDHEGNPWPQLTDLRVLRAPGCDAWAAQQVRPEMASAQQARYLTASAA